MTRAPAQGEQTALRGFRWQYDHVAALVYDGLLDGTFEALRLVDPMVGRVDDLVLVSRTEGVGFQFKSAEHPEAITFNKLLAPGRTGSGRPAPSLIAALGDGWQRLRDRHGAAIVHLVTAEHASTGDHLCVGLDDGRPSPDHFSAFLQKVLEPLAAGDLTLASVPDGWAPAVDRLLVASGLPEHVWGEFLRGLRIKTSTAPALICASASRAADIRQLSDALYRRVSEAHEVVLLDRDAVLALVGWQDRPRHRSGHEFPVDLDTYQPLVSAIEIIEGLLDEHDSGYIALVGPPGAGKSTLLSQALSGLPDRIIRYYAYIPGLAPARTRMTAQAFVHDLVVMLTQSGLTTADRVLPSNDLQQSRQQLAELFDAAHQEYADSGRRTIVVVDGLDHVERDLAGTDALLDEMPRPEELPDGVVILVGSRTLSPLAAKAQHQVKDRGSIVDLREHLLSRGSILELCSRVPTVAELGKSLHERVVSLSGGHPLALSYLLNRLNGTDGDSADAVLDGAPAYAGDIAAEYLAVWATFQSDFEVRRILAACSRLRIGFELSWFSNWADARSFDFFKRNLLYLFRRHVDGWRFFHDSFRQFAVDHTALDEYENFDQASDAAWHLKIADLCSGSTVTALRDEELHHRYSGGQLETVRSLATSRTFRDQHSRLRAPDLIRDDVAVALSAAADCGDVPAVVRLILVMVEFDQRVSALEDVDVPRVLYQAGLVDQAVEYCGVEVRRVPMAHAYGLSGLLARDSHNNGEKAVAGRRVFDMVEPDGIDDGQQRLAGTEDDAAQAWGCAAPFFRPLGDVLRTVDRMRTEYDSRFGHGRALRRYRRVMTSIIGAVASRDDPDLLIEVQQALTATLSEQRAADSAGRATVDEAPSDEDEEETADLGGRHHDSELATIAGCLTSAVMLRMTLETDSDRRSALLAELTDALVGCPLHTESLLEIAEALFEDAQVDRAETLVARMDLYPDLAVADLGYDSLDGTLRTRFMYWRLRHLIAAQPGHGGAFPEPTSPNPSTPAGNEIVAGAATHANTEAIAIAQRVNRAVQTLARISAASRRMEPLPLHEAWTDIVPILSIFGRATIQTDATVSGLARHRNPLLGLVVKVAAEHSRGLIQKVVDILERRIAEDPETWPPKLRLSLARELRRIGIEAPWQDAALTQEESDIEGLDAHSRLQDTASLVAMYSREGRIDDSQRLARSMLSRSFDVGYRKDYQFDGWVDWVGRALSEPGTDVAIVEAAWLARLLNVAGPVTEGAPARAAGNLPAAVVAADPTVAVRLFTYLVGTGTAAHESTLAELVAALVQTIAEDDAHALWLATDLTTELIIPASRSSHPRLAENLAAAAARCMDASESRQLVDKIELAIISRALGTTRYDWLVALGRPTPSPRPVSADTASASISDYGGLRLTDGQAIPREDVPALAADAASVAGLRRREAPDSQYRWSSLLESLTFTAQDLEILVPLFSGDAAGEGEPSVVFAEHAHRLGDDELALRLAREARDRSRPESWSGHYGAARRRAAALIVRIGGRDGLVESLNDLGRQVIDSRWLAGMLIDELPELLGTLAPETPAHVIWPDIRNYLEGMAASLRLHDDDPLSDRGARWWMQTEAKGGPAPDSQPPQATGPSPAGRALASLAVLHLSHPAWLAREGAVRVVASALLRDDAATAEALARFAATPDASEDTVDFAGRAMVAGRKQGEPPLAVLASFDATLAGHRNLLLRGLASTPSAADYRPLPPLYGLILPASVDVMGRHRATLGPFANAYDVLAKVSGLDANTLINVATSYANGIQRELPSDVDVRFALSGADFQHFAPTMALWAERITFGRVLGDLFDARRLDRANPEVMRLLSGFDVHVIMQAPGRRPNLIPPPPSGGHDQTLRAWQDGIDARLHEYVDAATRGDVVIGAWCTLRVLNWENVAEDLIVGTVLGPTPVPAEEAMAVVDSALISDLRHMSRPSSLAAKSPLVVQNEPHLLMQPQADWLAFRPDVAARLGWKPDADEPGTWRTPDGRVAVYTASWTDGWWDHTGKAFDDTCARGHIVALSQEGLAELLRTLGSISRTIQLARGQGHLGPGGDTWTRAHRSTFRPQ